jgi:hypothetical protein
MACVPPGAAAYFGVAALGGATGGTGGDFRVRAGNLKSCASPRAGLLRVVLLTTRCSVFMRLPSKIGIQVGVRLILGFIKQINGFRQAAFREIFS